MISREQIKYAQKRMEEEFNNYDCHCDWLDILRECMEILIDTTVQDTMKDENGLLPCPHCGGKAKLEVSESSHVRLDNYKIYCVYCGASIGDTSDMYVKQEVIEAWNNRTINKENFNLTNELNNDTVLFEQCFNVLSSAYRFEETDTLQLNLIEAIRERIEKRF